MDANLVRPARFELTFDERAVPKHFDQTIVRYCTLATRLYRHFFAIVRAACQRRINRPIAVWSSGNDGMIATIDRVPSKLSG